MSQLNQAIENVLTQMRVQKNGTEFHEPYTAGKGFKFSPAILLGKAFRTEQYSITTTAIEIIRDNQQKFYNVLVPSGTNVYIGHKGVSSTSGFLLPSDSVVSFGVMENVSVWALGAGNTTLYLLDMGLY